MAEKKERTVKDIRNEYGKTKSELTDLREGNYYTQNEEGNMVGSIAETLNVAKGELFEKFAAANEGLTAKSVEELDEETKAKYDKFIAEGNEVDEVYKNTDEKVKEINKERNKRLHEASEKLDQLEQEMKNKLDEVESKLKEKEIEVKEKQAKLDGLKASDYKTPEEFENAKKEIADEISKLNKEKSELESDKARLEEMLGEINRDTSNLTKEEKEQMRAEGKEVPQPGMKQRLRESLASQKLVRENAKNGAIALFGEDRVKDDFGMTDKEKEEKQKEEKQKEEENAQQQVNNQQIDPRMAAAAAQQVAKAAGVPNMGAVEAANVVENAEQEEIKPDYLGILGYNAGNVLNPKSSMALLDVYVGKNITDEDRLAMLNDPETRDVIFEAMNKANNSLNPLNRIKFNKTRARLVQLAKGEMVRKAVESLGEKHPENVEESFNKAKNEYNSLRKDIQDKMKGEITEEQKAELQTQLNELDKKYESINNVEMFRNNAKELERFRDRAAEKISNMLGKNDTLSLPAEKNNNEVKEVEQPKVTDSHEEVDFRSNLSGMNQDRNEVTKTDVENLAKNNQTLTQEQRKNAEKVLNSNDKSL